MPLKLLLHILVGTAAAAPTLDRSHDQQPIWQHKVLHAWFCNHHPNSRWCQARGSPPAPPPTLSPKLLGGVGANGTPSSPSADRQAYDSCLVDLGEARKEYKECAAKAAQVFTPKTKKELEDAVNEWCRNPGQSCSKFGDISEWDVSMGCDAMFGRRSEHVDASVGCLMQRSANRCKRQRASATSQERSCREVQKCLCAELALALARNRSG